ncbi:MAG: acetylornithine deacetylase (ArgE) [Betaproteobacteria bacterium RIFCSPLOWO2_02_FULL_63_19]|nr:MAG: acetylornithine deacetylase (ArgE) [Betaproteobacteria bacterium RIFCSPLOWO2_02_FULL_63_19]
MNADVSVVPSAETVDIIRRLIAFDTVSRNSNLGLIEWMRDCLRALGVKPRLTYDAEGGKANLFATLGDADGPGLVLCGHTDVVPVDGQPWNTDPFQADIREGRIYGRGSCDMKSFIACALAAAPQLIAERLKAPIHLAFTYDEEVGCIGVTTLLADLEQEGIRPSGCIVGEPTSMQVMTAHKGQRVYRCCVRGLEAHSSLAPFAVNAIEYAARLVSFIRDMAEEARRSGPRDEMFSVPHTTIQTAVIAGGTAANIVPRDCDFRFDMRYLPGTDPSGFIERIEQFAATSLVPEMRAVSKDTGIVLELLTDAPDLNTPDDDALTRLGVRLSGNGTIGRAGFATDGGHFHRAGVPTIVVGPGSIDQAHKPNEYIELEQVARCELFLSRLRDVMRAQ